jgi:hypothetical protein
MLIEKWKKAVMNRKIYSSNDILRLAEYQKCDDRVLHENRQDAETQKGKGIRRS